MRRDERFFILLDDLDVLEGLRSPFQFVDCGSVEANVGCPGPSTYPSTGHGGASCSASGKYVVHSLLLPLTLEVPQSETPVFEHRTSSRWRTKLLKKGLVCW